MSDAALLRQTRQFRGELRGDYRRTAAHEFSVCLSYRLAQGRPATTCRSGQAKGESASSALAARYTREWSRGPFSPLREEKTRTHAVSLCVPSWLGNLPDGRGD